METFDFAIRLDQLIISCIRGGNTPEQLQKELTRAILELYDKENPDGLVAIANETY